MELALDTKPLNPPWKESLILKPNREKVFAIAFVALLKGAGNSLAINCKPLEIPWNSLFIFNPKLDNPRFILFILLSIAELIISPT